MLYNVYFDICSLAILVTIALTSLSRRLISTYRQRAYSLLFFNVFVTTLAERIESYLQMNPSPEWWYHYAEMTMGSVYFLFHLASAYAYLVYIMSVLDIYTPLRSVKGMFTMLSGLVIGGGLVVINFFRPILFYYSEDGLYHRGSFIYLYYVIAGYYLLYSLYLIFKYSSLMLLKTKIIISSYVILVIVGITIQYFYPTLLVENFCNAISVTFVYITLQNPSEMIDGSLNILNRRAFLEGLDLNTKRKDSHYTIFVTIDNVRTLSSEIGYFQSQEALKKIAKYLKTIGLKKFRLSTYTHRYSEYLFAITVHTEDENKVSALMHTISNRLHEPWNFGNMALKASGHCFYMCYPRHYSSTADLITKVDLITEDISNVHQAVVNVDEVDFAELGKNKNFEMLVRDNLDGKKASIKFQPVLSKIYKINYSADVVCYFQDDIGNEIDIRHYMDIIKENQSLPELDEFILRKTCRTLAFWNAGDKNGKYRAIVAVTQGEISRHDFIRRIKRIFREEKAEPSWVSLKLTETDISTMNSVAERNLKLLKDLKCYIIVDRFGSGYGDLDKILTLPVTQINLDISVLRATSESEDMKKVAHGIVNLFHDISIFVCASGISSKQDQKMAEELECDFLIGDYMGSPMKDSSFVKFIDAYFDER